MSYEVRVVDQTGSSFGTLADAEVIRLSSELNAAGAAEIKLATTDPDADLLQLGREIQIFDDDDLIWWGVIVRSQAGLDETTWQCAELLWYFAHRFMGRADRTNLLTNGQFESGETDWLFSGVTHSIDTGTVNEGTNSLKLTGGAADHNTYAYQTWTHPAGGFPILGDWVTGAAWIYVPSASYVSGAKDDRGLMMIHRNPAGDVVDVKVAPIDDSTPRNEWVSIETGVPGVLEGATVEVRLYPPYGIAYFDTVTLTYMESLSFPSSEVDSGDVTDIIGGIVDYAQNRIFDHGKSDLNIGHGGSDTGVIRRVAYQFEEHRNILDAILEYVRNGTCDISMEITTTTRTLIVWPKSADTRTPKFGKGVAYATTLELDVNVAGFSFSRDLENAASTVVLLGPGDGSDRPEGNAYDPSFLGGAFTMEIVEQAPDDTTIGQLDNRAQERLDVAMRPDILEVTTLPGAGIIGDLAVGDTVTVIISRGWVDINDTYRVARIEADLLKDQATITLNAIPTVAA